MVHILDDVPAAFSQVELMDTETGSLSPDLFPEFDDTEEVEDTPFTVETSKQMIPLSLPVPPLTRAEVAEQQTAPPAQVEPTPKPATVLAEVPDISAEVRGLQATILKMQQDGDPYSIMGVVQARLKTLQEQNVILEQINSKVAALAALQSEYETITHGNPAIKAQEDGLLGEIERLQYALKMRKDELTMIRKNAQKGSASSDEAKAKKMEVLAFKADAQRWYAGLSKLPDGLTYADSPFKSRVESGQPQEKKERRPRKETDISARVWSGPMIKACLDGEVLPLTEDTAKTLPDLFKAVEASGCLKHLLQPGQSFNVFGSFETSKGNLFSKATSNAGYYVVPVEGTGAAGGEGARYYFSKK